MEPDEPGERLRRHIERQDFKYERSTSEWARPASQSSTHLLKKAGGLAGMELIELYAGHTIRVIESTPLQLISS